jgi:hypothetical protein
MSTAGGVVTTDAGGGAASSPSGTGLVTGASEPGSGPVASTEAPRVIIELEGHTVVLTAFDLLLVSTGALLAADLILTAAEVVA